jgi:Ca2+-binding RTX toxin-like protein
MSAGQRRLGPLRLALAALAAALLATAAFGATAARAAVKCRTEGEVLFVELSSSGDDATIGTEGGSIVVGAPANVACTGPAPTLTTIESVNVIGSTAEATITKVDQFSANGVGFIVALANGRFVVDGRLSAPDHIVVGTSGVDTDNDGDLDVSFLGVPNVEVLGSSLDDAISAAGGGTRGGPLTKGTIIRSFSGDDSIVGGEGVDELEAGDGNDLIQGRGGGDVIVPDQVTAGDDEVEGGSGDDYVYFQQNASPTRVDLEDKAVQETGQGKDRIVEVENVVGSLTAPNTLLGDEGPNRLIGGDGDDFFEGRGGDDFFEPGLGEDTVSYRGAEAAVIVDLLERRASGGAGADEINSGIDNVIGSPFADTLVGTDAPNLIEPLGGADKVQALGGDDTIRARDGAKDDISCGSGVDSAVVDGGLDTVRPDCERVDPPPAVAAPGAGGGAGAGTGSGKGGAEGGAKKVLLKLGGAETQRLVAKRALVVKVRCPEEACTASASASGRLAAVGSTPKQMLKLAKVTKKLPAGKAQKLTLRIGRRQAAAIAARLDAGKRVTLKVSVVATDAAGAAGHNSFAVTAKP